MPDSTLTQLLEDWNGYVALGDVARDESYPQRLKETVDLLSNASNLSPHKREFLIKEALTTSDFPLMFGDVLDRQMLASYKAVDPVWKAFVKMSTNKDFKDSYRFAITGGDQYLERVVEKGEYLASSRAELRYILAVLKYGRQFDISLESMINDNLGALKDTPERFARAAVRTEHRIITALYVADFGAHVEGDGGFLYENGVNCDADALSIAALENGVQIMNEFTDVGGEPILNSPKYLVVPPALEFTARQILSSTQKMWVYRGDAEGGPLAMPMTNVVNQIGLSLIIDPYLPILDDSSSGDTGWYLFSDPSNIAALEAAHLQGHERPEVCMKASDKVTVGGGAISPFAGDFDTDNIFYRVRLFFGACKLDWRATYMGGYAA